MYNESRGKDSCGYYYNGNVVKGVNNDSNFSDFIAYNKIESGDLKAKTFMGHTRKGTCGLSSKENAHPHVINNNYVQTHNGVIKEIWPLCTKYGVDHMGITVDSIGLAELIAKVGPKIILEQYKGFAALAFTWMDNPEALYLYHGASREKEDGELISERPLFALRQPEGIYYSSMRDSLCAINTNTDGEEPFSLVHNKVWEIVNGEFTGQKMTIERSDNNIEKPKYIAPIQPYAYKAPASAAKTSAKDSSNYRLDNKLLTPGNLGHAYDDNEVNEDDPILKEPTPVFTDDDNGKVLYHQSKYLQVKRYPSGVLATIPLDGDFLIDKTGHVVDESEGEILTTSARMDRYYFINGVMMKSRQAYDELRRQCVTGVTESTFRTLSVGAKYPIIQLKLYDHSEGKNLWYHKGSRVRRETFHPKFTEKSYTIRQGRTTKIV